LENFRAVGSGGFSLGRIMDGPVRFTQALFFSTEQNYVRPLPVLSRMILLGPAVVALWLNARERRFALWDWYFLFTTAITIVIFMSPGTDPNHLLELEVAGVLVLAGWWRRATEAALSAEVVARILMMAALVLGLVVSHNSRAAGPPIDAIAESELMDALPREGQLLTEDATPAVLLGRRPVVMDAFAYRLLIESGRIDPQALAERIERREFSAVVLLRRLDDQRTELIQRLHFGTRVTDAIRNAYRFERQIGAYYLYAPKKETDVTQ
jgi:hypothetical protein